MTALLVSAFVVAAIAIFHDVLLIAFGGLLMATLLNGLIEAIQTRFTFPRWLALAIGVMLVGAALAGTLFYGGTVLIRQYDSLRIAIPLALQESVRNLQSGPFGAVIPKNAADVQSIATGAMALVQRATGMISSSIGLLIAIAVMLFVGVCIAAEPQFYRTGFLAIVPPHSRARIGALLEEIGGTLRAWLVARLVSMTAIAILVAIGLTVLKIPYAIVLGVFSGALTFVPNIGALIAGIPAVLLALAIGPERAALVIGMYWIAHSLDDFIVIPLVERRIVHLPPGLTILVQIALGTTVGLLGIAFAAPLTAAAIIIVRVLWVDRGETIMAPEIDRS